MKDHKITQVVNRLRDIGRGREYPPDSQSLRCRISRYLTPILQEEESRLVRALEDYGTHQKGCFVASRSPVYCMCGFRIVLPQHAPKEGVKRP